MNTTNTTPAADRGSECNALLGPPVPDNVLAYLHAYGDSRADENGRSGLHLGIAIVALRRWAAAVQAAEREGCSARAMKAINANVSGDVARLIELVRIAVLAEGPNAELSG